MKEMLKHSVGKLKNKTHLTIHFSDVFFNALKEVINWKHYTETILCVHAKFSRKVNLYELIIVLFFLFVPSGFKTDSKFFPVHIQKSK